jgi:hypothetical protein
MFYDQSVQPENLKKINLTCMDALQHFYNYLRYHLPGTCVNKIKRR